MSRVPIAAILARGRHSVLAGNSRERDSRVSRLVTQTAIPANPVVVTARHRNAGDRPPGESQRGETSAFVKNLLRFEKAGLPVRERGD